MACLIFKHFTYIHVAIYFMLKNKINVDITIWMQGHQGVGWFDTPFMLILKKTIYKKKPRYLLKPIQKNKQQLKLMNKDVQNTLLLVSVFVIIIE